MSTLTTVVSQVTYRHLILPEDLNSPTNVIPADCHIENKELNRGLMQVRASFKQRTKIRLNFDVLSRYRSRCAYRRTLGTSLTLDCPTPEQAELVIEAIRGFVMSLDGKWLTAQQDGQSAANPLPIGGQSGGDHGKTDAGK